MRLTFRSAVALGTLLSTGIFTTSTQAQTLECSGLTGHDFGIADLVVASSEPTPAGEQSPLDHCLGRGHAAERTGIDGNTYAVTFELRLPDDWNGRFIHQFNGGNDGAVVPAMGNLMTGDPAD